MSKLKLSFYQYKNTVNRLKQVPIFVFFSLVIIISTGVVMLYSAAGGSFYPWAIKQLIYFGLFLPLMLIVALINIKFWYRLSYLSYLIVLILLLMMEIFGHRAMGAVRWINLGFIKVQPSELMKVCLILALSRYFHTVSYKNMQKTSYLIIPLSMTLIPFLLIIKQPDLGTALILLMLAGIIFFASGVSLWKFFITLLMVAALTPFIWHNLHDYQKKRIITFVHPEYDALGAGYNIIQSKIAIGSGGLFGKGLMHGSQSQLDFLPEHQTDFIFTMIAEELGFIYCTMIIVAYALIIFFGIYTAVNARNFYAKILSIGVTSLFFLHVTINIAMVMGLVPVVGVPLPLLSYGGTITLTTLTAIGMLINCYIHKNQYVGGNTNDFL